MAFPFHLTPSKRRISWNHAWVWARHNQMVCSQFWRLKHLSYSILLLKWLPQHLLGVTNLSDSILILPLTPILGLMQLWGVHAPPEPKPQHQVERWFPSLPLVTPNLTKSPHLFSRCPLGDLGDAQLRQLMEDLCQEVSQRDLTASPIGPPSACWRAPAGGADAGLEDEEVTIQGKRMGTWWAVTIACRPPSYRGGCWPPPQHTCSWINPKNKYIQWGCNPRENWGIVWTMAPSGTVCQGPLPGVSSPGKYNQVSSRDSSRYGLIYGSYCQCGPFFWGSYQSFLAW